MADTQRIEEVAAIVEAGRRAPSIRTIFAGLAAAGYNEATVTMTGRKVTIHASRQPSANAESSRSGPDDIDLAFGDDEDDD